LIGGFIDRSRHSPHKREMTDFRASPGAMRVTLPASNSSTAPDPEYGPVDRRVSARPQILLIVDDQDDLRRMWRFWLGLWNFRVVEARDGLEALVSTQTQHPIAIVMDLWMPRLDGLAAVRRIKASRETADIPIIGVTAQGLHTQISHDFAEYCDVLLEKPVDPDELLLHIRRALRRQRHD
jgi:CheY-like chemotaxis protein